MPTKIMYIYILLSVTRDMDCAMNVAASHILKTISEIAGSHESKKDK